MNIFVKRKMRKIIASAQYLEDTDPILALFEEEIPLEYICEYFGWPQPPELSPLNNSANTSFAYIPKDRESR